MSQGSQPDTPDGLTKPPADALLSRNQFEEGQKGIRFVVALGPGFRLHTVSIEDPDRRVHRCAVVAVRNAQHRRDVDR